MPKSDMDTVMVYPDFFHGFDAVPAIYTGQIEGRGVPYTVSRRGVRGHPFHCAAVIGSITKPERAAVIDPIHSDYPIMVPSYVSRLWTSGGIFSPRIPGGGGELTGKPFLRTGATRVVVLTSNPTVLARIQSAVGEQYEVYRVAGIESLLNAKPLEDIEAIYIETGDPKVREAIRELHARGISAELPVFTVLGKEKLYEDFDLSFTSGSFLPILEFETPEAIRVYLEQARDKWELFLGRHQYETPLYVPPQYPPNTKTDKQEGWLRKLFKRS